MRKVFSGFLVCLLMAMLPLGGCSSKSGSLLRPRSDKLAFANGRVSFDGKSVSFAEAVGFAEEKFGTLGALGSYKPPRAPGRRSGSRTCMRFPATSPATRLRRASGSSAGAPPSARRSARPSSCPTSSRSFPVATRSWPTGRRSRSTAS